MIFTNKHDLPRPYYLAASIDSYDKGQADYSITQLIGPPQISRLTSGNSDKLETDVADLMWNLTGKAFHTLLEKYDDEACLIEKRLFMLVDGKTISGQIDRLSKENCLSDWKSTSVWSVIYGRQDASRSRFDDYDKQLNCYAYLLRQNGHEVKKIEAWLILRDWQTNEAKRSAQRGSYYPEIPFYIHEAKMWSEADQEDYIRERIQIHQLDSTEKPWNCTDNERWMQPTKYAVMKEGRKTALRVLDSRDSACDWISENGHERGVKGIGIEVRPGRYTRCEDYCDAAPFCPQFNKQEAT